MGNHPNRSKIKDWATYLKKFRESHGFSQKELADKLQISQRNIENWEARISMPPAFLKKALDNLSNEEKGSK